MKVFTKMRLHKKIATVREIIESNENFQIIATFETENPAYSLTPFVGILKPGDIVLLNTTATYLKLGTGGYDYVIARISESAEVFENEIESHIMKLNYTPLQFSTRFIEETEEYENAVELYEKEGCVRSKVFVVTIHSHILPLLAGLSSSAYNPTNVVVIDDSSSLPAFLSQIVQLCLNNGLAREVITAGNSFGGTLEAMNLATAVIYASFSLKADNIIISPGFGIKGSSKRFGHSALRQAEALFYAEALGCVPYLVPRISFADKRERHRGISHHTVEIMELKKSGFKLLLPSFKQLDYQSSELLKVPEKLKSLTIEFEFDESFSEPLLAYKNHLKSMGRSYDEDPYFFLAPYACGCFGGVVKD